MSDATSKQKVSEWLANLSSHKIYIADKIAADFVQLTGEQPCWPTHTANSTRRAIKNRDLDGTLKTAKKTAWGYEIAEALASKYAGRFSPWQSGRDLRFHACLDAIKKAGA